MKLEEWRAIAGFPDYEVSSQGRVRRITAGSGTYCGKILNSVRGSGYAFISLRRNGRTISRRVHTLVCEAFRGPRPSPRHHAAHDDGNRANNAADNIFWKTPEENQADRIRHGTDIRGSEVAGAVLHERDIPRVRALLAEHVPAAVIARAFGVSSSSIHLIKHDKIWRAA